jgi:uncharacterized protein YgbK (DUF1537 family)
MWRRRNPSLFAIGSQGVEYALVAHWRAEGWLPTAAERSSVSEQPQIVAVSGSVSPVTASQIDWAQANGFDLIDFAAVATLDSRRWQVEIDATVERARVTSQRAVPRSSRLRVAPTTKPSLDFGQSSRPQGAIPSRSTRASAATRPDCQASH